MKSNTMDLDKTNKREIAQEKTEETETHPFVHSGVFDSFHFISQEIRKSRTFHNTLHFKKPKDLAMFFTLLSGIKEFFFLIVHTCIKSVFIIWNSYLPPRWKNEYP